MALAEKKPKLGGVQGADHPYYWFQAVGGFWSRGDGHSPTRDPAAAARMVSSVLIGAGHRALFWPPLWAEHRGKAGKLGCLGSWLHPSGRGKRGAGYKGAQPPSEFQVLGGVQGSSLPSCRTATVTGWPVYLVWWLIHPKTL